MPLRGPVMAPSMGQANFGATKPSNENITCKQVAKIAGCFFAALAIGLGGVYAMIYGGGAIINLIK
ncbi:MAG: hypothetical protein SP1CHLAM54_16120 [Chlamydiia bacterium]|nr:hypothetical protein [Chlamydiia bacterium]MCH9616501.1 hypothetical protein [Chlamydiia bacterium]MCH9629513.1 hypothetical protein [Chlamydiia bacterium]